MENHTTSKTRDTLLKDVDKLKQNAVQVVQDVRDHATAHVDATKQRVTDVVTATRENVLAHPMSLVGVGFAFGCCWVLSFGGRNLAQ